MSTKIKELPDQDYLAECLDYDPDSGKLVWRERPIDHFFENAVHQQPESIQKMWNKQRAGKPFGVIAKKHQGIIVQGKINDKYAAAHRVLWKLSYGVDPVDLVAVNGDYSDLRLANYAEAEKAQIVKSNRGFTKSNKAGRRGVYYVASMDRWRAYYSFNGEQKFRTFKTKEEAIKKREEWEKCDPDQLPFARVRRT